MTNKPITFEQFKAAIDTIIAHNKEIEAFTKAISPAFDGQHVFCTLGQNSITGLINLLQQVLGCGDWVEYFIYDCDLGNRPGGVTLTDGTEIVVDSVESIWEVICA